MIHWLAGRFGTPRTWQPRVAAVQNKIAKIIDLPIEISPRPVLIGTPALTLNRVWDAAPRAEPPSPGQARGQKRINSLLQSARQRGSEPSPTSQDHFSRSLCRVARPCQMDSYG